MPPSTTVGGVGGESGGVGKADAKGELATSAATSAAHTSAGSVAVPTTLWDGDAETLGAPLRESVADALVLVEAEGLSSAKDALVADTCKALVVALALMDDRVEAVELRDAAAEAEALT